MGFISEARESARAKRYTDDMYWQKLAYVFELRMPIQNPLLYPLLLGPSQYSIRRRFAQDVQIGQGGDLHVAEYGIVTAAISLTIDPGVAPGGPVALAGNKNARALSGHGRFKEIRKLFDDYSEMKKVATTASEVTLILHVLKDDESWIVVPVEHSLRRDKSAPVSYPYSIELIGAKRAEGLEEDLFATGAADKGMLEDFSDVGRSMRHAVQNIAADVDEIRGYVDDTRLATVSWTGLLDDVDRVMTAVGDFLSGVTAFIYLPHAAVARLATLIERAKEDYDATPNAKTAVSEWWASLGDQIDLIGAFPEQFGEPLDHAVGQRQHWERGAAGYSEGELARAGGSVVGSGARASDTTRLLGGERVQDRNPIYHGWVEHAVRAADSPDGIAARYRVPWLDIAAANRLRPPYFSETSLPFTVAPGQTIVVPSPYHGAGSTLNTRTGGTQKLGESQQEDAYGTDWLMDEAEGWAIDQMHGGTDFSWVTGVANVEQAIETRVQTERGANLVFPVFGLPFKVGGVNHLESRILAELAVRQALAGDPRIKKLHDLRVSLDGDQIVIEDSNVELELRSMLRSRGPRLR